MQLNALALTLPTAAVLLSFLPGAQQTGSVDHAQLTALAKGLGYETKDLSEAKFEINVKTTDFNVPLGVEISPSKRFIWLTAYIGESKPGSTRDNLGSKLLRENGKIQPSQFYVTSKDSLMCGLSIENKSVDAPTLKWAVDKLSEDVSKTAGVWNVGN